MPELSIRKEEMAPHFTKYHIDGLPFPAVLHHFTAPDLGDPHDHPWGFVSHILSGGYIEEMYNKKEGFICNEIREEGDAFEIRKEHIHRISRLLGDECWTLCLPQPGDTQTSGFYKWDINGTAYHRFWHDKEFKKLGERNEN